jgi:hypothetical protein
VRTEREREAGAATGRYWLGLRERQRGGKREREREREGGRREGGGGGRGGEQGGEPGGIGRSRSSPPTLQGGKVPSRIEGKETG